jgi:hypothetical protein
VRKHLLVAAAATASLVLLVPSQATAGNKSPKLTVLTTDVFAPFNLSVSRSGIYVADGFPGSVGKLPWHSDQVTTIIPDVPGASGVAKHGRYLAYTSTVTDEATFTNTASALYVKGPNGTVKADTLAYENANNSDQVITYGIDNPTQCEIDGLGPQANYTGQIDSHAYSVAHFGHKWVVADAGGNDLLLVDGNGHIRTLAVLPRQPAVITADFASANGLDPDCFAGATYNFESVPTDVEVGRDGFLYVTTLPGGPEGDELGARGSVYRVNPWNGKVHRIATGFSGATNLAIGRYGQIYVTELFAGRISVVRHHHVNPYVDLPGAIAVERGAHGNLLAATLDLSFSGPGSIVRVSANHQVNTLS